MILLLISTAFITASALALRLIDKTMRSREGTDAVVISKERKAGVNGDFAITYRFTYEGRSITRTMNVTGADAAKLSEGTRFNVHVDRRGRVASVYDRNHFLALCRRTAWILVWVPWGIVCVVIVIRRWMGFTPRRSLKTKLAIMREFIADYENHTLGELIYAHDEAVKPPSVYRFAPAARDTPSRVVQIDSYVRETYPPLPLRTLKKWMWDQPRPWNCENYIRHLESALRTIYPGYENAPVAGHSLLRDRDRANFLGAEICRPSHLKPVLPPDPAYITEALPDYDAFYLDLRHGDSASILQKAEAEWIIQHILKDSKRLFSFELARRRCNLAREIGTINQLPPTFPIMFARGGKIVETRRISPDEAWWAMRSTYGMSNIDMPFEHAFRWEDENAGHKYAFLSYKPGAQLIVEWSDDPISETTVNWGPELVAPQSFREPLIFKPCARWDEWFPYFPLQALLFSSVLINMLVLLVGFFFALKYSALDESASIRYSLRYSVPAWAVHAILTGIAGFYSVDNYRKGVRMSIGEALIGIIPLSMLTALPWMFSVWVCVEWINGAADHGPAMMHRAHIVEKQPIGDKDYFRYLHVPSWRPDHDVEKIRVSEEIYDRAAENMILLVRTKPGRLGLEWVVSSELASDKSKPGG